MNDSPSNQLPDWKTHGLRIIRSGELDTNTPQTPGMTRAEAISHAKVGAQKLWAGTVVVHPSAKTGPHHHGELETVIYVVRGRLSLGKSFGVRRRSRSRRFRLRSSLRASSRVERPHRPTSGGGHRAQWSGTDRRQPGHSESGGCSAQSTGRSIPLRAGKALNRAPGEF